MKNKLKLILITILLFNFTSCVLFFDMFANDISKYRGITYCWYFYFPKDSVDYVEKINDNADSIYLAKISAKEDTQSYTEYRVSADKDNDIFWIVDSEYKTNSRQFYNAINIKIHYSDGTTETFTTDVDLQRLDTNELIVIEKNLKSKKIPNGIKCVFDYELQKDDYN